MTYDELLAKIDKWLDLCLKYAMSDSQFLKMADFFYALRAVVELHKPSSNGFNTACYCNDISGYPCPTIQAIEKELK